MCAGDFLMAFKDDNEKFDAIVSVFFIDTAVNPIAYIRTIHRILKPGGVWVNFGPLTYHYEGSEEELSLELPYDQLIKVVEKIIMVINRRIDEFVSPSPYDLRATAIDSFSNCDYLVASGGRYTTFMYWSSVTMKRFITNRNVVRLIRCHHQNRLFALASAQEIDLCEYLEEFEDLKSLATLCGHSRSVLDLSWNPFDDHVLASCSEGDAVNLWDIRDTGKPFGELNMQLGASQVKFAPKLEYILCTTYGNDIRIWDIRPDAEEFATISLPSCNDAPNYVSVWRWGTFANCQTLKNDENDVLIDACWQNTSKKGVKYLYTLSKRKRLYKHPICYEIMNEGRDEMPTPIAQSDLDVERDRLAMEPRIDEQDAFEMTDYVEDGPDGSRMPPLSARSHLPSESFPTSQISRLVSGGTTPQLLSEWQQWITAPNVTECDLVTQLEALKANQNKVEGLALTEVNFPRAAIGFNYEHLCRYKRIYIEMRFHRDYLGNGKILIEVGQKDCPLTAAKAKLFLHLIQSEANEQKNVPVSYKEDTVMARVFQQIPKLIEEMKVFTDPMDIPNARMTSGNLSSSSEDKVSKNNSASNPTESSIAGSQIENEKREKLREYKISGYDEWVPAPRYSGCRFNGSGFLVTFGRTQWIRDGFRVNKTSVGDPMENVYGSSRKISFQANESDVTSVPTSRGRKPHSKSHHSVAMEEKNASQFRSFAEFQLSRAVQQIQIEKTSKRDVASQNVERVSISGGSPQSNFGYMPTVTSSTNMSQAYKMNNSARSTAKTSPSPSIPSGTSRSYSLQNVSQSLRHRGNSITGAGAEQADTTAVIPVDPLAYNVVTVYDATGLLPVSKELATRYRLLGLSALELCRHNQRVVEQSNRQDLRMVWKLLEQCIQSTIKSESQEAMIAIPDYSMRKNGAVKKDVKLFHNPFKTPWSHHPFGRNLINNLLDHYSKLCDLQTAAVIICILGQPIRKYGPKKFAHSSSNPFQSITDDEPDSNSNSHVGLVLKEIPHPTPPPSSSNPESLLRKTADELRTLKLKIPKRSSFDKDGHLSSSGGEEHTLPRRKLSPAALSTTYSAHETLNNSDSSGTLTWADGVEPSSKRHSRDKSENGEPNKDDYLLDPALASRFEDARLQYADILYRWRMYSKCTEVLKYCVSDTGIEQISEVCVCVSCGQILKNLKKCDRCKRPPITCAICDLPCRGATVTCPQCSHGGHLTHMTAWFQNQRTCPLGCGCDCKF